MPLKRMKEDAPGKHKKRVHKRPLNIRKILLSCFPAGRIPGNYWWGVSPGSPNLDPISDQKMSIFNPFSDLAIKKTFHANIIKIS